MKHAFELESFLGHLRDVGKTMTDVGSETTEMKTRGTIAVLDLDSHVSDPGDTGVIKLTAI